MKITKKLRNHILNIVAEVVMEKLDEHCPDADGRVRPDCWDESVREKYDLITDVTTGIEQRLSAKLSAMIL